MSNIPKEPVAWRWRVKVFDSDNNLWHLESTKPDLNSGVYQIQGLYTEGKLNSRRLKERVKTLEEELSHWHGIWETLGQLCPKEK